MLAIIHFLKSIANRMLGYHVFNWGLFADRARWTIAWSVYCANKRGSLEIEIIDFQSALILVNECNSMPESQGPILPFSKSAQEALRKAWQYKNRIGDRYFYTTHLTAILNNS